MLVCTLFIPLASFKAVPEHSKEKISKSVKKQTDIYIGYVGDPGSSGYFFIYGDLFTLTVSDVKYGTTTSESSAQPVYSYSGKITQPNGPYLFTGRVYITAGTFTAVNNGTITTDF